MKKRQNWPGLYAMMRSKRADLADKTEDLREGGGISL